VLDLQRPGQQVAKVGLVPILAIVEANDPHDLAAVREYVRDYRGVLSTQSLSLHMQYLVVDRNVAV
jgi:hypothetical protein